MKMVTKTFTETLTYRCFDVGERVSPQGTDTLSPGVYTVARFYHPVHASDKATIFVDGHRYGMDANKFVSVP